jgi:hypothetical protein
MDGYLRGMLHWQELDALWLRVRAEPQGWYLSQLGEAPPTSPLEAQALLRAVDEVDALLRREHRQTFCGVVFADAPEQPTFVKIFDPQHMGSMCSCSSEPVLPRWVLSRCPPDPLQVDAPAEGARRHWWSRLTGTAKP